MVEETEIITLEITTIFKNSPELPKPEYPAIAKMISDFLTIGNFNHDDVVVTKHQSFLREVEKNG